MSIRWVEITMANLGEFCLHYWEDGTIRHIRYTTKIDEYRISNFLRYGEEP